MNPLGIAPASAQSIQPGQSVADRAHPDYDALGTSLGGFTLYPSLQTSVDGTTNYRAVDTNPEGDVFFTVQPNARLTSNWSRHKIDVNTYYARSFHVTRASENVSQYGGQATGVYDYSRLTSFRVDVAATHAAESRSGLGSFRNSVEPVRYEDYRAGIAMTQELDPISLDFQLSAERINYHDARLRGGTTIDQDFRDVKFITAGGGAKYDLRNGIALVANATYQRNTYEFGPGSRGFDPATDIDRRSTGVNLLGGVSLELSKLVIGFIQVGYLTRNYQDSRLRDLSGLSFNANVLWNVTSLTSIRFRAARSIEETSSQAVAGNTRTDFSVRADHELYRNLILNADVNYGRFTPNGIGFGGDEYGIGAGARYLLNRRYSLTAGLRYNRRDSESSFLRYNALSGGVGLRISL